MKSKYWYLCIISACIAMLVSGCAKEPLRTYHQSASETVGLNNLPHVLSNNNPSDSHAINGQDNPVFGPPMPLMSGKIPDPPVLPYQPLVSGGENQTSSPRLTSETYTFLGKATQENGAPISGLKLALRERTEKGEIKNTFYAVTNDQGEYRFEGVSRNIMPQLYLNDDKTDWAFTEENSEPVIDRNIVTQNLKLVKIFPTVAGSVALTSSKLISGVKAELCDVGLKPTTKYAEATTGSGGKFEMPLSNRKMQYEHTYLHLTHPEIPDIWVKLTLTKPSHNLTIPKPIPLSGTIRFGDGKPLQNAPIMLRLKPNLSDDVHAVVVAESNTDNEGTFTFAKAAEGEGVVLFQVSADDKLIGESKIKTDTSGSKFNIALPPLVVVSGSISDSKSKRPIKGSGFIRMMKTPDKSNGLTRIFAEPTAKPADDNGKFNTNIPVGTYIFEFGAPGYKSQRKEIKVVQGLSPLNIKLSKE